ncbi:hypothetical protein CR513_58590, partial [Mucuna pruriens]
MFKFKFKKSRNPLWSHNKFNCLSRSIIFLNLCVLTISLYNMRVLLYKEMNTIRFDVKNAFLHGDLEEEVYMEILLGFYSHNEKNKVCRLKKALFAQVMISLGYRKSQDDHTLFIKHSLDDKLTLLLVYVNDMIVTCDDEIEKLTLKEKVGNPI